MKRLLCVVALVCLAGIGRAAADRIAWDDGRLWEDVRITAYRLNNGVPEFHVEALTTAPDAPKPGWYSGARRIEFGGPAGVGETLLQGRRLGAYPPIEAAILKVIQADLLQLDTGQKVRLLGVDTPETTDPNRPLEFHGRESYLFTQKAVEGRRVRVEFDERRMDNFGNLLGYVCVLPDETLLNLALVQTGHGHAWFGEPVNDERAAALREAETGARQQQLGIWNVERRRASVREWQIIDAQALQASGQARTGSVGALSAGGSGYPLNDRSLAARRRGRGRSITVGVELSQRPVPAWIPGVGFGFAPSTELTVQPRF